MWIMKKMLFNFIINQIFQWKMTNILCYTSVSLNCVISPYYYFFYKTTEFNCLPLRTSKNAERYESNFTHYITILKYREIASPLEIDMLALSFWTRSILVRFRSSNKGYPNIYSGLTNSTVWGKFFQRMHVPNYWVENVCLWKFFDSKADSIQCLYVLLFFEITTIM